MVKAALTVTAGVAAAAGRLRPFGARGGLSARARRRLAGRVRGLRGRAGLVILMDKGFGARWLGEFEKFDFAVNSKHNAASLAKSRFTVKTRDDASRMARTWRKRD